MATGLKAALTAIAAFYAPLEHPKAQRPVAGAWRGAGAEILNRARLDQTRAAIVVSLWAEQPAKQCAVQSRFTMRPSEQDRALMPLTSVRANAAEPVGARAVWAQLQAAGIQFTDGGSVEVVTGASNTGLSSVARLPRTRSMSAASSRQAA